MVGARRPAASAARNGRAAEDALGVVGVQPDLLPLVRRQRPRLLPDRGGIGDAPEVVDERGAADSAPRRRRRARTARRRGGQLGHAGGMAGQVGRGEVGEVAHRRQRAIDRVALERQLRRRFGGERRVPGRAVRVEREELLGVVGEPAATPGRTRARRARGRTPRGVLRPPTMRWKVGVAGDVHDPHGERDLLAAGRPGSPLPSQRSVNAANSACTEGGSPSRSVSICADLAQRGEVAPVASVPRAAGGARSGRRADRRRSLGLRAARACARPGARPASRT